MNALIQFSSYVEKWFFLDKELMLLQGIGGNYKTQQGGQNINLVDKSESGERRQIKDRKKLVWDFALMSENCALSRRCGTVCLRVYFEEGSEFQLQDHFLERNPALSLHAAAYFWKQMCILGRNPIYCSFEKIQINWYCEIYASGEINKYFWRQMCVLVGKT